MKRRSLALASLLVVALAPAARAWSADAALASAAPFGTPVEDERTYSHVSLNQVEERFASGSRWEGEGWIGTDENRLWVKSEGLVDRHGAVRDSQQQLLYDRPVSPFFDVQAGVRYDLDSRPGRGWAAFGIEGLAPYFVHVAATGFAGAGGRLAAKMEASYEAYITQRLALEPQAEINLYTRSDPGRRTGSGLSDVDAGLRLRYEITRKFAPYVALVYARSFGGTADFLKQDNESRGGLRFTLGVKTWF